MNIHEQRAKLVVRNATLGDVENIRLLAERVYSANMAYTRDMIRGQIQNYRKYCV